MLSCVASQSLAIALSASITGFLMLITRGIPVPMISKSPIRREPKIRLASSRTKTGVIAA